MLSVIVRARRERQLQRRRGSSSSFGRTVLPGVSRARTSFAGVPVVQVLGNDSSDDDEDYSAGPEYAPTATEIARELHEELANYERVAALRRQLDGARARDRQGAVIDSREFLAELEDAIARLRIVLNALEGTSVAPYDTPRTAGAQPSPLWAWLCCGRASAAASGGVVSPDKTGAGGELSFDHTFKTTRTAAADDTESCAVCLQVLAGTAVVALKCDCSHFYHRSCIEMWLRAKAWSPTCPLCQGAVEPGRLKKRGPKGKR